MNVKLSKKSFYKEIEWTTKQEKFIRIDKWSKGALTELKIKSLYTKIYNKIVSEIKNNKINENIIYKGVATIHSNEDNPLREYKFDLHFDIIYEDNTILFKWDYLLSWKRIKNQILGRNVLIVWKAELNSLEELKVEDMENKVIIINRLSNLVLNIIKNEQLS